MGNSIFKSVEEQHIYGYFYFKIDQNFKNERDNIINDVQDLICSKCFETAHKICNNKYVIILFPRNHLYSRFEISEVGNQNRYNIIYKNLKKVNKYLERYSNIRYYFRYGDEYNNYEIF